MLHHLHSTPAEAAAAAVKTARVRMLVGANTAVATVAVTVAITAIPRILKGSQRGRERHILPLLVLPPTSEPPPSPSSLSPSPSPPPRITTTTTATSTSTTGSAARSRWHNPRRGRHLLRLRSHLLCCLHRRGRRRRRRRRRHRLSRRSRSRSRSRQCPRPERSDWRERWVCENKMT